MLFILFKSLSFSEMLPRSRTQLEFSTHCQNVRGREQNNNIFRNILIIFNNFLDHYRKIYVILNIILLSMYKVVGWHIILSLFLNEKYFRSIH